MRRLMSLRESTGGDKFRERHIALAFRWEAMAPSQSVDFEAACFITVNHHVMILLHNCLV